VRYVLTRTLQLPEEIIAEGQAIPPTLKATIAEQQETLRPDLVILEPEPEATRGRADSSPPPLSEANSPAPLPRLLIQIVPPGQDLDKPLADHHWKPPRKYG
jgi:hypothetical protein